MQIDERAAFEAWAETVGLNHLERGFGGLDDYEFVETRRMWAAWRGRAALSALRLPAGIDAKTMDLAESAGLIGPTSRVHDLHAAIQRFHDLIVVNASIRAAQDFSKELVTLTAAQHKHQVFVLTVNQMRQAIEFATGGFTPDTEAELEASLSFSVGKVQDGDGKIVADGVYCWLTKLAEEGALPLDEYPTARDIASLSEPTE